MSEARMWAYLRERLDEVFHLERITEMMRQGVADVNYLHKATRTEGWVELKYLPGYPPSWKRTPQEHFTSPSAGDVVLLTYGPHGLQKEQSLWLWTRARANGRAGVLLNVGGSTGDWFYWRAESRVSWHTDIRYTNVPPTCAWYGRLSFPGLAGALTD